MRVDDTWRPCQRADVAMEVLPDGSALLYDPQTDTGHALAAFAGLVWDMCDGTLTPAEMRAELAQLLPATLDIPGALHALLTEFTEMGLLETEQA